MPTGQTMFNHHPSAEGGYIGYYQKVDLTDISVANPAVATIEAWPPVMSGRNQGSPIIRSGVTTWSATISGVTGAFAASINGLRTMTRTGDQTFSIGVNTLAQTYDATNASVDLVPMDLVSSYVPKESRLDFSGT